MPGFGTTGRTYQNAVNLMKSYNVTWKEISIKEASLQHFKDIGIDENDRTVTYENTQARERTQILMDVANKEGALVIGTGDLSELALGWCTYNGDHMSMYAVNTSIPKTLVRYLVNYYADIEENEIAKKTIKDILDTPVSPELLPPDSKGNIQQQTESVIGPYVLHDFFLYHFLRYGASPKKIKFIALKAFKDMYDEETIDKWLNMFIKRFFSQQFKRSCLPDGPKVGTISVSPRGDLRMPSDADNTIWLER
jgi:NAD+ synthase (glutamine-hydrolysing)